MIWHLLVLQVALVTIAKGECNLSELEYASDIKSNGEGSILLIGKPNTVCFEYAKREFASRGCQVSIKELNSQELAYYQECYPNEKVNGMEMHSFVYVGQDMVGNGHRVASTWTNEKIQSACPKKSNEESCNSEPLLSVGKDIQATLSGAKSGIYLWGWRGCPCVATARRRFQQNEVCYQEDTWDTQNDPRMDYFQKCTDATVQDHSFIFVWDGSKMKFIGNGFIFGQTMNDDQFSKLVSTSQAKTTCEIPGIEGAAKNLFDEPLEKCSSTGKAAGSSQMTGKCDELDGGVHSLCVNELPADFSSETGQSPWSAQKKGEPWCVCIGAWSMYQAKGRNVGANCNAIPDFVFQKKYINNWSTWNGNELNDQIVDGINELYNQCKKDASASQLSALRTHYCNVAKEYKGKEKDFSTTPEFKDACEGGEHALSAYLAKSIDVVHPFNVITLGVFIVGFVYFAVRCLKNRCVQKGYKEIHETEESYSTFVSVKN